LPGFDHERRELTMEMAKLKGVNNKGTK
jgi:hypothetical protein